MTTRPLPRGPRFVRSHGKAVHVLDNATTAGYDRDALGDPALDPYIKAAETSEQRPLGAGPTNPIRHLLGVVKTRCGREIVRNRGGLGASGSLVSTFDDDDLCRGCYATVAPDEQGRLFEHDQESPDKTATNDTDARDPR